MGKNEHRPTVKFLWTVVVSYITKDGKLDVTYDMVDLSSLNGIVENGPHFDSIDSIVMVRINKTKQLTLEDTMKKGE